MSPRPIELMEATCHCGEVGDLDGKLFTPEAHLYAGEKKYHSEEWTGKSFV